MYKNNKLFNFSWSKILFSILLIYLTASCTLKQNTVIPDDGTATPLSQVVPSAIINNNDKTPTPTATVKANTLTLTPDSLALSADGFFVASDYQEHKGIGFINSTGQFVIQPSYQMAYDFSDGLAAVQIGEKWGFIDTRGNLAIQPQFAAVESFFDGLALVGVDTDNGSKLYGYIDKTGNFVIQPQFREGWAGSFSEGAAIIFHGVGNGDESQGVSFIDKTGKELFKGERYFAAYPFSDGMAAVNLFENQTNHEGGGTSWGYIDHSGEFIVQPNYAKAWPFSEGLAAVYFGDQYGFITLSGEVAFQSRFQEVQPFSEGLAAVKPAVPQLWGFIDTNGNIVITAQFEFVHAFSDGLALVNIQGKYGYIDKSGNYVIQTQYSYGNDFRDGLAYINYYADDWSKTTEGYINKQGECVYCAETSLDLPTSTPTSTPIAKIEQGPLPLTNLNSIAMNSSSDGWAVGTSGTILYWDGSVWSSVESPTTNNLTGVYSLSPSSAWAVGYKGTIIHWDGKSWQLMDTPEKLPLGSIVMISDVDGWAVGSIALHWDGNTWTSVPSVIFDIFGVDALASNDVWISGFREHRGPFAHWNGIEWEDIDSRNGISMDAIDMITPRDGWAVGSGDYQIMHWDGDKWLPIDNPSSETWLKSVDMLPSDYGWIVGATTIMRWAATHWVEVPNPTSSLLQDVDTISQDDAWIVGAETTIMHWDGSNWTIIYTSK